MAKDQTEDDLMFLLGTFLAAALRKAGTEVGGNAGPRLLKVQDAAEYLGMRETKFRELEGRGEVPKRLVHCSMPRWDRRDLDRHIDQLSKQQKRPSNAKAWE